MPKSPYNSHMPGKEPPKGKRLPLEDAVCIYIDDAADKARALGFAEWLRRNKISPSAGNNGYNWYVKFHYVNQNASKDGKYQRSTYHGIYIKLFNDTWHILPSKDILEQVLMRDDIKETVWDSIFPCYGCSYGCYKQAHNTERNKSLFGRDVSVKGVCPRQPLCFTNPSDKTLDVLKEILLKRKNSDDLIIGANMNIYNYGMI
ncbi:MAG: hypothetical protein FWB88_03185 [Defluviitaleaceae bacterium]|nr:hypothetical protein [Defluviitaleaceae bacterium]MCL2238446.1 hypothetical protein [Defluviitaleaceae bacterium]